MSSFLAYSSTVSIYLFSYYAILAYCFSALDFILLQSSMTFSLVLYFCINSSSISALMISCNRLKMSCAFFLAPSINSCVSSHFPWICLFFEIRSFKGPSVFKFFPDESRNILVISLNELTSPLIASMIYRLVCWRQSGGTLVTSSFSYSSASSTGGASTSFNPSSSFLVSGSGFGAAFFAPVILYSSSLNLSCSSSKWLRLSRSSLSNFPLKLLTFWTQSL